MFRNQKLGVQQSVHRERASQSLATNSDGKHSRASYAAFWALQRPQIRVISPSDQEQVVPLFLHYFAVEDSSSGHAVMSFMPPKIPTADDDALSATIASIGYALLSNITRSEDKLIMARKKYGDAMRIICDTLEKTTLEESCRVMRVVLLLAFFEASRPDYMRKIFQACSKMLTRNRYSPAKTHRLCPPGRNISEEPCVC
jgi:hypothetical protein